MDLKNLYQKVETEATWEKMGVKVTVIIRAVRSSYGRLEAQIEPLSGSGTKWVEISSLVFPEGK